MSLADTITLSRLAVLPGLVVAAITGASSWFAALVAFALVSDAVDGRVARWRGTAGPRGAWLDSVADAAFYLTAPSCALVLHPELRGVHAPLVIVVIVSLATPPVAGWLRYGRLPAYHTHLARATEVTLGAGFLLFVLGGTSWLLYPGAAVLVLSTVEELAITWTLPAWTPDVPSILHARRSHRAT